MFYTIIFEDGSYGSGQKLYLALSPRFGLTKFGSAGNPRESIRHRHSFNRGKAVSVLFTFADDQSRSAIKYS